MYVWPSSKASDEKISILKVLSVFFVKIATNDDGGEADPVEVKLPTVVFRHVLGLIMQAERVKDVFSVIK